MNPRTYRIYTVDKSETIHDEITGDSTILACLFSPACAFIILLSPGKHDRLDPAFKDIRSTFYFPCVAAACRKGSRALLAQ